MSQIDLNVSPFEIINQKQVFKCCDSVFPEIIGQKFVLISVEEYIKTSPNKSMQVDPNPRIRDIIKRHNKRNRGGKINNF